MCGIAGVYALEGRLPAGAGERVETLLGALRHRGPDDSGVWLGPRLALGHTRLSIIDVPGGHQPIAGEDGRVQIVFNGEIYNFLDLRPALLRRHRFSTRSDTEVIVHQYEDEGPDAVQALDGMFAFALADGDDLFLARDPLGVKPLYHATVDGHLYFASEIKALLPVTDRIEEFPPGHWFHSRHGWRRYFDLEDWVGQAVQGREADPEAAVREAFAASVKKRLVSDVPVGVFLSGGLDSSLVAALMRRDTETLHSFSVGTAEGTDPEHARLVAEHLGTVHHERLYAEADMVAALPRVIRHLESFDFALVRSAVANYFVAALARQHGVKVVLVGEGADELFAGYHYLKDIGDEAALARELTRITGALHNSNLQRVDRMSMAHGVEAREPYLDLGILRTALRVPAPLKQKDGVEKWVLRQAFVGALPEEVLWREKEKFSRGAGSALVFEAIAEREISDAAFERARRPSPGITLRSKEELYYYRVWRETFPDAAAACLGWTASPGAR